MNLHYSQTWIIALVASPCFNTLWIYTTLKRESYGIQVQLRFNTLWIYTTLKHLCTFVKCEGVLIPYEFTLLSNSSNAVFILSIVLIPYEFTLLSNEGIAEKNKKLVLIPYEFTLLSNAVKWVSKLVTF